jgi:hypothetical protein
MALQAAAGASPDAAAPGRLPEPGVAVGALP